MIQGGAEGNNVNDLLYRAAAAWQRVLMPAGREGYVDQQCGTPLDRYNPHMALLREQVRAGIIKHVEAGTALALARAGLAETRTSAGE